MKFFSEDHRFPILQREMWLLRGICCCLFLGRSYQHLFLDAPYRLILWSDTLMRPLVERMLGLTWQEYLATDLSQSGFSPLTRGLGFFYLLCGLASLVIRSQSVSKPGEHRIWGMCLWMGALSLFMLSYLHFIEQYARIGQLIEETGQWSTPLFLVWAVRHQHHTPNGRFWMRLAIAMTFAGHGLYAVGYHKIPATFIDMTITILHVTEDTARIFLHIVGTLDFVVAIGIFIPRVTQPLLLYAAFWGTITSVARIAAHLRWDTWGSDLLSWTYQTLYRLPHAGLPLLLFLFVRQASLRTRTNA